MKVLLLPLVAVAVVSANIVSFRPADPEYYADYGVDTSNNATNPELMVQLSLNNYDITDMNTNDGTQGLFMGIGFGS